MTPTGTNRQFHVKAVINKPTNSTVGTVVAYAKLNGATTDLRQMSDMGGFHQTNMKFNVNVPNGATLTIEVKATIQKICEPTSAAVAVNCP